MRAFALAALLALPASRPDILPPGQGTVRHELQLTWNDDLSSWRFVASPTRGLHGSTVIAPGEPFAFSSKYGTRIYAVPTTASVPADSQLLGEGDWPRGDIPVGQVWAVPYGHPLQHVISSLRVRAVHGGTIDLELLGERRFGPFGLPLGPAPWLPLVVIAAAGVVLLRRCRARRPGVPA